MRSIIATTDVRALGRYFSADTVARFSLLTLSGTPADLGVGSELEIVVLDRADAKLLTNVAAVERAVLGYARSDAELRWILEGREGYLYLRDGEVTGVTFVGREGVGPLAAIDARDLVPMLKHVEARAAALGLDRLSFQVPGLNAMAVRHLLARGYRIDPWINLLMANQPFGQFHRFLAFSPVFL